MRPTKGSNNVARATQILLTLGSAERDGLSLGELSEILGDSKPNLHRALTSLAETGFVLQKVRRGKYQLGPAIYGLATRTPTVPELVKLARPRLVEITAATGLSSFLMLRAGLDTICVDMQLGRISAPAMVDGIGGRVPLGAGLSGIALLGQLEAATVQEILLSNEAELTAVGVTQAQIKDEIEAFQAKGYAVGKRAGDGFSNLTLAFPVSDLAPSGSQASISVLAPIALETGQLLDDLIQKIQAVLQKLQLPPWQL
ncbi:MAG: helix-turn-helix domain-containing protein [Pseudomonadota bacterium]|nr:helix-turn-helix domain-containing protein [Pseudomonadota bacterium]